MADNAHYGWQGLSADNHPYNEIAFQIAQALSEARTIMPVKIVAVHGGGVGAPPRVDVMPLVNQWNGRGEKQNHGVVYNIPVSRSQGGSSAIINDPIVGDIGLMTIADRDISALKATDGAQSNPGSFRQFNPADGVYVGSMLMSAAPTRYITMTGPGIEIHDGNGNVIVMAGGNITMNGVEIDQDGNISTPGDLTVKANGGSSVTLSTHEHPTTPDGPPSAPTPGT